ncbi:recombinase family protein [Carbonactinospora thermoautotrophica]|uniref:recombinase family protein n=1 Tax=Carbonactinospora thermoautotrophica TaxID=1469144 RepID=UPI0022720DBA|nr:recombinase family protein [Carbonactinospora thermoautotrophica]MCX9191751.1 recombinase family protein [Carbonactinospora thermoautotrophica]
MARVLGVIRLSRNKDDSTSVARQKQYITNWADQNGHVIVGWAEDVDVSGSVAPWVRPELGKWLPATIGKDVSEEAHRIAYAESRANDFDILCVWRLDRLSRRVIHLSALIEWCQANGKTLVSTSEGFDVTTPMGKVFVQILAALAEGELEAIKERAKSSYMHLMRKGRWRGGFVPFGYQPVKQENGEGWKLEVDPKSARVMLEIVGRVMMGHSVNSVCRWLNEERIPTPLDWQRIRAGKEPKGAVWRVGNLIKMLRSHTLLGYAEMTETVTTPEGGKQEVTRLVRGEGGLPLRRAEPLISREDWELLRKKLDANSNKKAGNRTGGSPLLRVAYCGECGKPMYRNKGRGGWYYRCASKAISGKGCGNPAIRADELEKWAEETLLTLVGGLEIVRRVFVPGADYSKELEEVNRALKELREDRAAGLYSGEQGTQEFREMYKQLEERRKQLEALPTRPDEWREEPTGQTYRERWESLRTHEERNRELREAGIRLLVYSKPPRQLNIFGEAVESQSGSRIAVEIPRDLKARLVKLLARS